MPTLKNEQNINNLKQSKASITTIVPGILKTICLPSTFRDACPALLASIFLIMMRLLRKEKKKRKEEKKKRKTTQDGILSHVICKSQALREPEFILEKINSRSNMNLLSSSPKKQVALKPERRIPGQSHQGVLGSP